MPPLIQVIILGALQAISEFLPISSSAHLLVVPWLLGWKHLGLFFDVSLHYGTALAVLLYFREDWLRILRSFLHLGLRRRAEDPEALRLLGILMVGTVPAGLAGVLGQRTIEEQLRQPWIAGACLVVFGLLLVVSDRLAKSEKNIGQVKIADGFWIGLAQSLALVPGVSRSGITIIVGRLLKFERPDAARFSFLLATPVILGAATYESYKYLRHQSFERPDIVIVIIGTLVSAVAGWFCIHYFLRYLRSGSFMPFAVYRMALALLIWYAY